MCWFYLLRSFLLIVVFISYRRLCTCVSVVTLGGHILIALITVILLFSGYDLFPTDFETLPMYDWDVPWLKRDFAWRFRHEYNQRYVRKWFLQVGNTVINHHCLLS